MTTPTEFATSYRKQRELEKRAAEARANQTGDGQGCWQELNNLVAMRDATTHLGSLSKAAIVLSTQKGHCI